MNNVSHADMLLHGGGIAHHFGDDGSGVYMKEVRIPAGTSLGMHTHTFTHKSVLCAGRVELVADGDSRQIVGPAVLTLRQGVAHEVRALTDCVWLCVHATDVSDENEIDHTLMGAVA